MTDMDNKDKGFVLPTSLVMMLLMTVLSIGVYYGVSVSQSTSASAKSSTEAFYYAETGANYLIWALKNDAEFDSYTYTGLVDSVATGGTNRYTFGEPDARPGTTLSDPNAVGDYTEWKANKGNPSAEDTVEAELVLYAGVGYGGQLKYFDNSALASRPVCHPSSLCGGTAPVLDGINIKAPRYIRLDIAADGQITPALPPYNSTNALHHGSTVGVDVPLNGAIVWLTGGDSTTDRRLEPIDKYFAPLQDGNGKAIVTSANVVGALSLVSNWPLADVAPQGAFRNPVTGWLAYKNVNTHCNIYDQDVTQPSGVHPDLLIACDKENGGWLQSNQYGLVAYVVGYVDGKARKLLRIVLPSPL